MMNVVDVFVLLEVGISELVVVGMMGIVFNWFMYLAV